MNTRARQRCRDKSLVLKLVEHQLATGPFSLFYFRKKPQKIMQTKIQSQKPKITNNHMLPPWIELCLDAEGNGDLWSPWPHSHQSAPKNIRIQLKLHGFNLQFHIATTLSTHMFWFNHISALISLNSIFNFTNLQLYPYTDMYMFISYNSALIPTNSIFNFT